VPAPRRVLFVNPTGDISGAEKSLLVLLSGLDRAAFQPIVWCPFEGPLVAACRQAGVPVVIGPVTGVTGGRPRFVARELAHGVRQALSFARYLRAQRIDVLHVNSFRVALACSLGARLVRVPVVWHVRDIPASPGKQRAITLLASLLADRILVVSRAVEAVFRLGRTPLARVRLVYNGIDMRSMEPRADRETTRGALGLKPDDFVVGCFTQLHPKKGQHVLLEAAAAVVGSLPSARFLIAGDRIRTAFRVPRDWTAYPEQLRRLHGRLELGERAMFLGFREDIPDLLAALDVFAHTPTAPDPLPRCVLEAMAAGVPLVCTGTGGTRELVTHDVSALLVAPGAVDQVAAAILALARDPGRRDALARAARRRAEAAFSVERCVAAVQAVYHELVDGGTGR
jgi:glycosyltransferase involved in cell wall biosynthesis